MGEQRVGMGEHGAAAGAAVLAPVDGAAFTVMVSDASRETIWASDQLATDIEAAQYDVGAGPTLQAYTTGRPAMLSDTAAVARHGRHAGSATARWPILAPTLAAMSVGALFAVPMQWGAAVAGVCTCYRQRPGPLSGAELAALLRGVDTATLSLLAPVTGPEDPLLAGSGPARAVVHQATGMLTVQLGVPLGEAFARLRAHGFAVGRPLDEIAADIVARRLRLEQDDP